MRYTVLLVLLALSVNVFADYHFKLKGVVFNELNNQVLHLKIEDYYSKKKYEVEYKVKIQNGIFEFEGALRNITEYATLSIFGKGINYFHYIMIDSGSNTIKFLPVSAKSPTYKNKLSNAYMVGSSSNELSEKITNLTNYYYTRYSTPSLKNPAVLSLTRQKVIELDKAKVEIIRQYPNSFGSLIQLYIISNKNTLAVDSLLDCFSALSLSVRESDLGFGYRQHMKYRKSVEIGQPISLFQSSTSNGVSFENKSLMGRPYLLAFGATWCKPCKEDYPRLKKIYENYKQAGFEIVSVNMDDQKQTWLSQIASNSLSWISISQLKKWEETDLAQIFNVVYLPYYILVGKNGTIVYNSVQVKDNDLVELEKRILAEVNN